MKKRLYRSTQDKILAGVVGGFAEYFNMDSTFLRLLFILALLVTGLFPGVIFYIIAWLMLPESPAEVHNVSS